MSERVFVQQRLFNKTKEEEMMLLELRGREAKKKSVKQLWLGEDERRFCGGGRCGAEGVESGGVDGNIREGRVEKRVSALREAIGKGSFMYTHSNHSSGCN